MSDLKNIIYNCRQATYLIEKKQFTRLSVRERVELKMHLAGCSVCRLFQEQSVLISRQIRQLLHSNSNQDKRLDESYKKELQQKIDEKIKE